jgi:hypothetical protein
MAIASVTLTSSLLSPSVKTVRAVGVTVAWKNNNTADPYVNGTTAAKVQTQTFENPTYALTGVHFDGGNNVLTYADLLLLAKLRYNGSNSIKLTVVYGLAGSTSNLVASDGSTTAIPVVLRDFTFPIIVTESTGGYRPVATINFQETS